MARQWYFQESDGSERGPLSGDNLRVLVKSGRIRRETLVRSDENSGWVIAERLKGLFSDAEPAPVPVAAQAELGPKSQPATTKPPTVEPKRVEATQSRTPDLATGPEWDDFSEYLATRTPQPLITGRAIPRPTTSPNPKTGPDIKAIPKDFDIDATSTSNRYHQSKSIMLSLFTNPRDAFGQALDRGMLAYAISIIVASGVLFVMMWVPALYRIESQQVMMQGRMFGFPGGMPGFPRVAKAAPAEPEPDTLTRVLTRLGEVAPRMLLAIGVSLLSIVFLGTLATAVLVTEPQPHPIRRSVTALGFSLTPLVLLNSCALLLGFVATEISVFLVYLGIFVSLLYYHEALQSICGVPLIRAVYCTPLIFAAGLYVLLRTGASAGADLLMGGLPF